MSINSPQSETSDAVLYDGQLAARVRDLRLARGASLRDVERATGISRSTLSALESGGANPTLSTLVGLAGYFDLHSLEELFGPLPSAGLMTSRVGDSAD